MAIGETLHTAALRNLTGAHVDARSASAFRQRRACIGKFQRGIQVLGGAQHARAVAMQRPQVGGGRP